MIMKHRISRNAVIMAVSLALLAVSSCFFILLPDSRSPESTAIEDTVTVSWWGSDSRNAYMLEGIEGFEDDNPSIAVKPYFSMSEGYEKRFGMLMDGHDEADVMLVDHKLMHDYSDRYMDLSTLDDLDLSSYSTEELQSGQLEGKQIAVPISWNMMLFAYNKDMVSDYNLTIPSTWRDLFADAAVMKEKGKHLLYMKDEDAFFMIYAYTVQTDGAEWFDEQGKYTGTAASVKTALDFYQKLLDEGVLVQNDSSDSFTNMECACIGTWADEIKDACNPLLQTRHNVRLGMLMSENGNTTKGWYHIPGCLYAISNETSHASSSVKLLNYLIHDQDLTEMQGIDKGIPVSQETRTVLKERGLVSGIILDSSNPVMNQAETLNDLNPSLEDDTVSDAFFHAYKSYGNSDAGAEALHNELHEAFG